MNSKFICSDDSAYVGPSHQVVLFLISLLFSSRIVRTIALWKTLIHKCC